VARVEDADSGRVMEIESTMPGVQFYTGNKLAGFSDRSSSELPKHAALCLETQFYPDSPNQPEFPSTILHPGEEFTHRTVHRFSTA
jgi:aldose 1-epimerase